MVDRRNKTISAAAAMLAGAVLYVQTAGAQSPLVELVPLAQGYSSARQVRLHSKGPSDILHGRIVIHAGGDTGWHSHPGPVLVTVTTGTLTEYHSNGCTSLYQKGDVFFEQPGAIHRVINHGSETAEAYATFILPAGTQPLQPAMEPRSRPCSADPDH